jgi:hypothetical protein
MIIMMMTIDVTVEFPNNETAAVITKVVCNLKGFSLKKVHYNMVCASTCNMVCYLDVLSLEIQPCVSAVFSYKDHTGLPLVLVSVGVALLGQLIIAP